MATFASKFITNQIGTAVSPYAGNEVINAFFIDVTTAQLVLNSIFDIGVLPAGHTIASCTLIPDDLDTGAAIALDVGILSGDPGDLVTARTMGAEIFAADVAARTGVISNATLPTAFRIRPTDADRSIGVKVQAAPGTAVAGRIRLLVRMYPADRGYQF